MDDLTRHPLYKGHALEDYTEARFKWDLEATELASKWTAWAAAYALAVGSQENGRIEVLTDQLAELTLETELLTREMPEFTK